MRALPMGNWQHHSQQRELSNTYIRQRVATQKVWSFFGCAFQDFGCFTVFRFLRRREVMDLFETTLDRLEIKFSLF